MNDIEQELIEKLRMTLEKKLPELVGSGISFDDPTVQIWNSVYEQYTSEIRLTIRRNQQIDDALEFYLFKDGQQVISLKEAMDWIASELSKLQIGGL